MTQIREVLSRPLDQKIVEVIQVDQINEQDVHNEITEYVVTDRIRDHYERLLRAVAEARTNPEESTGVWVSGFFGSGKSSFAKNLGYVLANPPVLGRPAADLFKEQAQDATISALIDTINATLPTEVIMFDVQKDRSQAGSGNLSISPFVYRVLLRELGYAEDFDLAELEIQLEREERLAEFVERFDARYAQTERAGWTRQGRKGAEVWNRVGAILHDMDPATYPTEESFARALAEKHVEVTPRLVVDRAFELMARRRPGKALTLIIDEVGQYVAYSQDRLEDLRALVELFGAESRNRVRARTAPGPAWVVVTSQERLDEVTSALGTDKRTLLAKVRDRFKWEVDLSPADIREVATKRVLSKNRDGVTLLKQRFAQHEGQLHTACKLERTTRARELTADEFVQFYPYLPHYIDLSIDIMAGIRLQPGAMRHLGGSNRTIISQVYQMLVNPRTYYADRPVGALVSLDQIYELIEGQIGSAKQKDIADIVMRSKGDPADGGWAARVAKAIALLEFVRDLPRTAANLAAVLVDRLGQAAPLPEVQAALARLEEAQFVRNTEDGYKLQTAQERSWDEERRSFVPRPRDRDDILRELLGKIAEEQRLRTHRYQNKTFKIGLAINDARSGDAGDVLLDLLVADDAGQVRQKRAQAVQDSRQAAHQSTLYWVFALDSDIDERVARLYAGKEMIAKYSQTGAEHRLPPELVPMLGAERKEVDQVQSRLKDKLDEAIRAGQGCFRGVTRDAASLGRTTPEIFGAFYDRALPDLYPKLEMGTRPLRGTEAEEVLKAANLQGLSQVFYAGEQGLNLITREGAKYVPNKEAEVAKEVLDYLKRENSYGNKVTGKDLERHFGGIGYGWELDVLQLVLAVLLRAGAIEVTHGGRKFRNHQDPQSRAPFTTVPAFRNASFAPREAISLSTLTQAVGAYEDLTGDEVDVEETAIATAFKRLADDELRGLLPVIATARANRLPVLDTLEEYRQTLEAAVAAASDDCVRTLAGEGNSLKAARKQVGHIRTAVSDANLARLAAARAVRDQVWPLLQGRPEGQALAAAAHELAAALQAPDFFDHLAEIDRHAGALLAAYGRLYQQAHAARFGAVRQALADVETRAATLGVVDSARAAVLAGAGTHVATATAAVPAEVWAATLAPLTARLCPADAAAPDGTADLTGGAVTCRRCGATLGQMESDLAAVAGLKARVLDRLAELIAPEDRVERVRVRDFFPDALDSPAAVDSALEQFAAHLHKLVAERARIVLE